MSFKDKFKGALDSLASSDFNLDSIKERIKKASESVGAQLLGEGLKMIAPMMESQIRKKIREEIIKKAGFKMPDNPIIKAGVELALDGAVAVVWEEIKSKLKDLKGSIADS